LENKDARARYGVLKGQSGRKSPQRARERREALPENGTEDCSAGHRSHGQETEIYDRRAREDQPTS